MSKTFAFYPVQYWQDFEDLTLQLFYHVYGDSFAKKNGRPGQVQHGVDVFGSLGGKGIRVGIQCKRLDDTDADGNRLPGGALTEKMIKKEVAEAVKMRLKLDHLVFATTAKADGKMQRWVEQWSDERQEADPSTFRISALYWHDFEGHLNANAALRSWYDKHIVRRLTKGEADQHILEVIHAAFSRRAFQDPLHREVAIDFWGAILHTERAVNLGELLDRKTGVVIRKSVGGVESFSKKSLRNAGAKLLTEVRTLRDTYADGRDSGRLVEDGALLIRDDVLRDELDHLRRQCLRLANKLLGAAGRALVESPLL